MKKRIVTHWVRAIAGIIVAIGIAVSGSYGTVAAAPTAGGHEMAQAAVQYVTAHIADGDVRGFAQDGVKYYRGIPYAKPPIGELRWKPPVDPEPWQGTLDATRYRSEALQTDYLGEFATPGGSEDCLYVNVAVPERQAGDPERYPVFVWIHGGALVVGAGSDYDPSLLAKQGRRIVVTVNYRLGVFGFFAHPAIDAEPHATVNYGIMDQIAALKWVQRNIADFGGDPTKVTVAGESSGGQSAQILMASPKAKGLFTNVIAMSAPIMFADGHAISKAKAEERGKGLAAAVGLTNPTAAELRRIPAQTLLQAGDKYVIDGGITIDGEYVTRSVAEAFRDGDVNGDRIGMGNVANEGSFFAALQEQKNGAPMDEDGYMAALQALGKRYNIPDFAERVAKEYPLSRYGSPAEAYAQVITDSWFATPIYRTADILNDHIPVYYYEFDDPTNPPYMKASFPQGSAHTYELPYLFPDFHGGSARSTALDERQRRLSKAMVKLWTQMAEPDTQRLWQPLTDDRNVYLHIGEPSPMMRDMQAYKERHHFRFWSTFPMY